MPNVEHDATLLEDLAARVEAAAPISDTWRGLLSQWGQAKRVHLAALLRDVAARLRDGTLEL